MNTLHKQERRTPGFALPVVLAVICILGIIAGNYWQTWKSDRALLNLQLTKVQTSLSMNSCLEMAHHREVSSEGLQIPWNYKLSLTKDHLCSLSVYGDILFGALNAYTWNKGIQTSINQSYSLSRKLDTGMSSVALWITNKNAKIALAGSSDILGKIVSTNTPIFSTAPLLPYSGIRHSLLHAATEFKNDTLWSETAAQWIESREIKVAWNESPQRNWSKDTIRSPTPVEISDDAHLKYCMIIAPKVTISGYATIESSVIIADTIQLREHANIRESQIVGKRLISINLLDEQEQISWYTVIGKNGANKEPYLGSLEIQKFQGKAVFSILGSSRKSDSECYARGRNLHLNGVIASNCPVSMEGNLKGMIWAPSLFYDTLGTRWENYLVNLKIESDSLSQFHLPFHVPSRFRSSIFKPEHSSK